VPAKFPLWDFSAAAGHATTALAASHDLFLDSIDLFEPHNTATARLHPPLNDNIKSNQQSIVPVPNYGLYSTSRLF
jgi:hypothetical protein